VKVDRKTKLIKKSVVTDASAHDSQVVTDLVDDTDVGKTIHADSAYSGQQQLDEITERQTIPKVCEKGYRNEPLTKAQMRRNKSLSRKRVRVEHVFGHMTMSMCGMVVRCVGIV
jgi:IS5 family transposase